MSDQEGAVRPPEGLGIERSDEVLERAVIRGALGFAGHDEKRNHRSTEAQTNLRRLHQQQFLLRPHTGFSPAVMNSVSAPKLADQLL